MNANDELKAGAAALVRMYQHIHRVSEGRAFADPAVYDLARSFAAEFEAGLVSITSTRAIAASAPARSAGSLNGFDNTAPAAATPAVAGSAAAAAPPAAAGPTSAGDGPRTAAEFLKVEEA